MALSKREELGADVTTQGSPLSRHSSKVTPTHSELCVHGCFSTAYLYSQMHTMTPTRGVERLASAMKMNTAVTGYCGGVCKKGQD